MSVLQGLEESIKKGKNTDAVAAVQQALADNEDPGKILNAMVTGMDDVGRRFKANIIFVPEVLVAARAMKQSMELLEPALVAAGIKPEFTAVIGTVQGDLHDIGKNLVSMMWKGANFNVVDLGTNVTPDRFAAAVTESNAHVVGLSALLTTTMPAMKNTVEKIREAAGDSVKILIGGAPVTQEYSDEIGADGYAADAASAVDLVRNLVKS